MTDAEPPLILTSARLSEVMRSPLEARGWRVGVAETVTKDDIAHVRAILQFGPLTLLRDVLLALPKPGLVACATAGYDGIDVDWCRAHDIEITHAQGDNADEVADLALGLLLAGWRDIASSDRTMRGSGWAYPARISDLPRGLRGRKVGVVGLGHIGSAIARRVEAFGMTVAWWGPNPKPAPWPRAASLLALAVDSDILVIASRADPENSGMISAEVIDAVGPQGMIVNVARGMLIDEDALIAALKAGRLGKAGLDVFVQEPTPKGRWDDVPNTVLTPHIGGATTDGLNHLMAQAVENIRRHLAGQPLLSPVARRTPATGEREGLDIKT